MPDEDVEELLTRAIAFHQGGKLEAAVRLYEDVLAREPDQVSALNNLAAICTAKQDYNRSERLLQRAIELAPQHANAYNNLGRVFELRGQWLQAEVCYVQTLQLAPQHASARNNLGNVRKARGDLVGAVDCYLEAHRLMPGEASILGNLGNCLLELGNLADAERCFRTGLTLTPSSSELLNGLGRVLQTAGEAEASLEPFLQAIELEPSYRPAYNNLGVALLELNRVDEARRRFQQALDLDGNDLEARFNLALSLPILYRSSEEVLEHRAHFATGLQTLCDTLLRETLIREAEAERLLDILARHTNFYLQYQGFDDLALQQLYGALLIHAASVMFPPFAGRRPAARARVRVGFISACFRDHAVGKLMRGFVEAHDPEQFEIYTYYLGFEIQSLTRVYQQHSAVFRHLPRRLESLVEVLRRDSLDILVFGEAGMTPVLSALAAARVAPVQCVFWGHPITTGLPTVDYFISSEGMEPEDAQAHYTEKLLTLSGVGICYPRPVLPPLTRNRADFGLEPEDIVYLSCQSLYKYLPEYDRLYPAIAARVPRARFVFLRHPTAEPITRLFKARLEAAFEAVGLSFALHCRFLPHQSQSDYFALNQVSDVFLDTVGWSGGNTTLEALACNLPVVTLPGAFMRGRHAYAMLKALELEECIAGSEEEYVRLAVRLGLDEAWRSGLRQQIRSLADERLFGQVKVVRELEARFLRMLEVG